MQYKALLTVLAFASSMASVTSAGVLQKRHCGSTARQFCCAVQEVPDKEILPNLYLFTYGLGCEEISDGPDCITASSQPHGICCAATDTQTGPFGTVFCYTNHA